MGSRHRRRRQNNSAACRGLIYEQGDPVEPASRASPTRHRDAARDIAAHPGQPRTSPKQPDYALPGIIPMTAMQGPMTQRAPASSLTQTPYV